MTANSTTNSMCGKSINSESINNHFQRWLPQILRFPH
jgi:hypothetical protein